MKNPEIYRLRYKIWLPLLLSSLLAIPSFYFQNEKSTITTLPILGTWNGYNNHNIVLECSNLSSNTENLQIILKNASNAVIGIEDITVPSLSSTHTLFNKFPINNNYGIFELNGTAQGYNIFCKPITYKFKDANVLEYTTTTFTEETIKGRSGGVYNSMSPNAKGIVFNWLSIVNPSNREFSALVKVRDQAGVEIPSKSFTINQLLAGQRIDKALGHEDGQVVGTYEIIPDDPDLDYNAFLNRYSQVSTNEYNFSMSIAASKGYSNSGLVPASTMGPAINWGEIANLSEMSSTVFIEIFDRNGQLIHAEHRDIEAYSQYHVYLNQHIGNLNVGFFKVTALNNLSKLIVQSAYYGTDNENPSEINWAYNSPANGDQFIKSSSYPINTNLKAANWLKVFSKNYESASSLSLEIFNEFGKKLDLKEKRIISFMGSIDVPIHELVPPNFIGRLSIETIESNNPFQAQILRVYPEEYDSSKINTILSINSKNSNNLNDSSEPNPPTKSSPTPTTPQPQPSAHITIETPSTDPTSSPTTTNPIPSPQQPITEPIELEEGEPIRPANVEFKGIGTDMTWDNRLSIHVENSQIKVRAIRPQKIRKNQRTGLPIINNCSLDKTNEQCAYSVAKALIWPNGRSVHDGFFTHHGAVSKNPRINTPNRENPYRCNYIAGQNFPLKHEINGKHLCYEIGLFTAITPIQGTITDRKMGFIPGQIVVDAFESDLSPKVEPNILMAQFTKEPEILSYIESNQSQHSTINLWEPSITEDGRLLFIQGSFTYNFSPTFASNSWTKPENIGKMFYIDNNVSLEGLSFKERYPIARERLRDSFGNYCDDPQKTNGTCGGGYPWISRDGADLFYAGTAIPVMAHLRGCANPIIDTPKASTSVIGLHTNYVEKLLDSHANFNRLSFNTQVRAFGLFGTMWEPFQELENLAIPYTQSKNVYGIITSDRYSEVNFEPEQDGQYIINLPMNELRGRVSLTDDNKKNAFLNTNGEYRISENPISPSNPLGLSDIECAKQKIGGNFTGNNYKNHYINSPRAHYISQELTPDLSGNFHNAKLNTGAYFPQEYYLLNPQVEPTINRDESNGYVGRAVILSEGGSIIVNSQIATNYSVTINKKNKIIKYNENANFKKLNTPLRNATIELAIKFLSKPSGDINIASRDGAWRILKDASNHLKVQLQDSNSNKIIEMSSSTNIEINSWYHIAVTFDTSSNLLTLYINGTRDSIIPISQNSTLLAPDSADIILGPNLKNGDTRNGIMIIDEVAVSDVARTHLEVIRKSFRRASNRFIKIPDVKYLPNSLSPPLGLSANEMRLPNEIYDLVSNQPIKYDLATALGGKLFNDTKLSGKNISCNTCHSQTNKFIDIRVDGSGNRVKVSPGADGKLGTRNSPTILNRAFSTKQFLDGRSTNLLNQVLLPLTNPNEMAGDMPSILKYLNADSNYKNKFLDVFGSSSSSITAKQLSIALASFVLGKLEGDSIVDRINLGITTNADLDHPNFAQIISGRSLFFGKARCASCHAGSNFTDELFHNTGTGTPDDQGRYNITKRLADLGSFKTPTLRAIKDTAPYFHNGSFSTLKEVVIFYNIGTTKNLNLDKEIRPLGLNEIEINDLVVFLEQL